MQLKKCVWLACLLFWFGRIEGEKRHRVVCFYTNWSQHRNGVAKFLPEHMKHALPLCTHVIYAFASINEKDYRIAMNYDNDKELIQGLHEWKKEHPELKTMLSIGGWSHDVDVKRFSQMVSRNSRQIRLIQSSIDTMKRYGFDGIDIDWEYPGSRGSPPSDKNRYLKFLKKMRADFDAATGNSTERYLLSASVSASPRIIPFAYDADDMAEAVDWVNVMAYNLHGSWRNITSCGTAMSGPPPTVVESVQMWLDQGMPPNKVSLGIAAYGKTYTLVDAKNNSLGAPIRGPGDPGPFTLRKGILSNYEICRLNWETEVDHEMSGCGVPYSTTGTQWVAHETPASITFKIKTLVHGKNLGGISFWSLDHDDFKRYCKHTKKNFPLLRAADQALNRNVKTSHGVSKGSQQSGNLCLNIATLFSVFLKITLF